MKKIRISLRCCYLTKLMIFLKLTTFLFLISFANVTARDLIVKESSDLLQQTKVSGTVTDEKGNSLPGVTVFVKGTTIGTLTAASGKYTIDDAPQNATLVFSFIGMTTQEIPLQGRMLIDVVLLEQVTSLEEVVVVGYGTQKRLNISGSVASITTKDIKSLPVANVSSGLVGRLPGIKSVDRGGVPGSTPNINIRGFDNMLIIVDGVENSFNNIDPNEIESINILKDASAAIYGARAGNGVMLVTTKRGKSEAPAFAFNAYYGLQSPTRIAKSVDAATYAQMVNDAQIAGGGVAKYTDAEIQKYKDGTDPDYPNTNWYNEVFKKASPISQYNLNASGGGETVRYFLSLGYLNQEGLFKSGDLGFRRFNFRSNIDSKITKSFSISLNLSGRDEFYYEPGGDIKSVMEDVGFGEPTRPARYPDPTKLAFNGHGTTQPIGRSSKEFAGYKNRDIKYLDAALNFKYDAPFIPGLSASVLLTSNMIYGYVKNFGKQFFYYFYDRATDKYTLAGVAQASKNQLDEQLDRTANYTGQWHLNYEKTIGVHNINALIVGEYIDNSANWFNAHREGYISTAIDQLFAGADLAKNNNGSQTQDGRIGYIGRLNYSYATKYFVELSSRYDASARYISSKRWGFFPSISLGWRLSEEDFLKNISAIENLKLRVSIGKAGNDYVAKYNYLTGYNFSGSQVFGSTVNLGILTKGLANPDLTWENTMTYNIGLDGSFWNKLFGMELDLFYRKVTNVAGYRSASLPFSFGASLPQENINSYDNRGFELVLKHENTLNALRYTIAGNVSYSRKKWLHYDEPTYPDAATRERLQVSGQWDNRFFGYTALGLFQSQAEIDAWTVIQDNNDNKTLRPGDIKYEDYNKDGKLDFLDNHVIGRGFIPDVIYGLDLGLQYKGFDLSMLWQGASNFNLYSRGRMTDYFDTGTVPYTYMVDYWSPTNTDAKYPRIFSSGATNNKYVSTFWLKNAAYLRLKTIQVGYNIPNNLCARMHVKSLYFYFSGFNLLTLDKIHPFPMDPETGNEGTNQYYHQQKSYNVGINLKF